MHWPYIGKHKSRRDDPFLWDHATNMGGYSTYFMNDATIHLDSNCSVQLRRYDAWGKYYGIYSLQVNTKRYSS